MPKDWERKAGKSFLNKLEEVVLEVGNTTFTRREMIEDVQCGCLAAAARLDRAIAVFKPKSIADLARRMSLGDLLQVEGVGTATVWVWMCVLNWYGIDPVEWIRDDRVVPTLYQEQRKKKRRRT